jgi:NCAIR mutase (PurE)-related protein
MTAPLEDSPLRRLLERVARGEVSIDEAAGRLARTDGPEALSTARSTSSGSPGLGSTNAPAASEGTASAMIDLDRWRRCGYPEVVYGPGKSAAEVVEIFGVLRRHGQACLATRVSPEQAAAVKGAFAEAVHNESARTVRVGVVEGSAAGRVCVLTAGTGDRPVAEEAAETARWMGCKVDLVYDVGVAGPHRLPSQRHRFERADAIVVVAGMEAALPSVVAGYVGCPVIGVPTSIGYGTNFGGLAAVLSMLNSCAANVAVVNIDAGFKGGFLAGLIAGRKVVERVAAREEQAPDRTGAEWD